MQLLLQRVLGSGRCRGLGTGHLRGCWICCVLGETCLSMEACGFWWATCAAAGGKSLSPCEETIDSWLTVKEESGERVLLTQPRQFPAGVGDGSAVGYCCGWPGPAGQQNQGADSDMSPQDGTAMTLARPPAWRRLSCFPGCICFGHVNREQANKSRVSHWDL